VNCWPNARVSTCAGRRARHDRLIAQIVGLERRVSRAGRDSIDHAPGAHDDIANAVSGVVAIASGVGSAWMNLVWD
jgi:hypothetical protein